MKNIPYKKIIENGKIVNPITKEAPYISAAPSRRIRHSRQARFIGNNNGYHLTVLKTVKYRRFIQHELKENKPKRIEHYLLIKNKLK